MSPVAALAVPVDAYGAPSLRRLGLASALTVVVGFGGCGAWAALTPLDSAVPATGAFVAATKRKTVNLLDNGILKRLLVAEGDRVIAGQPLFTLEDVQPRAVMMQAGALYWGAVAKAARLEAEISDRRRLEFPADLAAAAASDPAVAAVMNAERGLFSSRWDTFDGNARVTARKVQQLLAQQAALRAQVQSLKTRLALTQEASRTVEGLLTQGYAPKPRALELRSSVAQFQGDLADAEGRLIAAGEAIEQTKLEFTGTAETRRSDAAKDMQEAKAAMADNAQRLTATRDILSRSVVGAPEPGIVTDIKFFTPGSSITAGQPVLDIVPSEGKLLLEAGVSPNDIEHVHVGQRVNVKLSAYKAHRVPTVTGHLVYVAADRQPDAHGDPVFLVRVKLDDGALTPYEGVMVYAGMPADVLIIGGERTALDFIVSPIVDGMRRAMREE